MRFKKSVIEALIDEVEDVQSGYGASFEEDGPPTASINAKMLGRWLWVSGRADYEGATWDQSTDRASGDPYSAHVFRDWVGKKKTAPTTVSSYEELHEWSLFHTRYEQEYTDVGSWGVHKDRYIRDVSEKGVVTINAVSNRRFQDVSPSSETVDDTLDLSIFESITFEKLIELLQDPNSLVREVAAKQLGHLQDARAIDPYLIQAVDDESKYVRDYAIGALGALGGQKSIKKLSELILGSKYPPESAIYALSKIGEPSISSISPGLHSENQAVRIGSVSILQNIGGEKAIKLLRNSLKNNLTEEYQHTLISIINAFGDVEAAETIDDILPLMTHENPSVQFAVLTALRKMKSEQVAAPLVEGLLTSHHWVRKEIVEVLDEMGWKPSNQEEERWIFFAKEEWEKLISMEDSAIEIILLALKDKDEYHRCKILSPLSKAGIKFSDQRIADAIISIYRNKGQADYLRRGAIEALVSVPTAKTVSFLLREFPKVEDEYSQGKFIDTLKSMILSDTDVSSKVVSYLKRMNPENQSEKEIAGYVELFKIMPLTPKQIQTIRPWVIAIDKKELKEDQEKIVSSLLSLELVIATIGDESFDARKKAMDVLSDIQIPSAIFPLLKALEDSHYYIREKAPSLIGSLGEGAVSETISALEHENYRVRSGAAEALGRLRNALAAEALLLALNDNNRIVRQNAVWALGNLYLHHDRYDNLRAKIIKSLAKCMVKDNYLPVRINAVYSLGILDDKRTVKHLLSSMEYKEVGFRLNATYGFIKLAQVVSRDSKEGENIISRLITALSDEVARVRYNAVDGLRLFGGEKALEAVKKVRVDEDTEMQKIVDSAIHEIKSMLGRKRSSWSYTKRIHVQLRDPEVIEELIPLFMDESESNQRSTQIALSKFGDLAYDRMIELLTNKEQHYLIRMGAAATLGDIGDKRATDILIETLSDEHDDVRCNAAWALAELKDERSRRALLKATKDTNWQVRLNAGAALGKIKGRGALDALLRLSQDENPQVRHVCTSYLGYFKDPRVLPALKAQLNDQDKNVRKIAKDWIAQLEK